MCRARRTCCGRWMLVYRATRPVMCQRFERRHAVGGAHLGALVVDGDLVVAVRVFARQKRLQRLFDLNKEATGLQ